jgi:hypothetical protein
MRDVDNEMILRSMRQMAWHRAKGELEAVLATYWHDPKFESMNGAVYDLINKVEGFGLAE